MSAPRGSHSKLGQGSISGGGATTPQNTFCFTTQRNIKTLQRHNTHSHSQSQRKTQRQRQVGNTQCIELCTFMYLPTFVHFISMWTRTNQSWLNNQLCLAAFITNKISGQIFSLKLTFWILAFSPPTRLTGEGGDLSYCGGKISAMKNSWISSFWNFRFTESRNFVFEGNFANVFNCIAKNNNLFHNSKKLMTRKLLNQ